MQEPTPITQERYREIKASPKAHIAKQAFICRHCHKHFRIGSYYTDFCSEAHELAFKKALNIPAKKRTYSTATLMTYENKRMHTCPACERQFEARRIDQVYCSSTCRTSAFHREARKWHDLYVSEKALWLQERDDLIREIATLRELLEKEKNDGSPL